jgi:hypothetical protein
MYVPTTTQLHDYHCLAKSLKSHIHHNMFLESRKCIGKLSKSHRKALQFYGKCRKLSAETSECCLEQQPVCNIQIATKYVGPDHPGSTEPTWRPLSTIIIPRNASKLIGKQSELIGKCRNRSENDRKVPESIGNRVESLRNDPNYAAHDWETAE